MATVERHTRLLGSLPRGPLPLQLRACLGAMLEEGFSFEPGGDNAVERVAGPRLRHRRWLIVPDANMSEIVKGRLSDKEEEKRAHYNRDLAERLTVVDPAPFPPWVIPDPGRP